MTIGDVIKLIQEDSTGMCLRAAVRVAAEKQLHGTLRQYLNALAPLIELYGEPDTLRMVAEASALLLAASQLD
jgi:hypothetical protein